jgi:ArsR family transcriptional regulator, zinc-responsive transcriptional repressor
MEKNKPSFNDDEIEELALRFKLLSEPSRLKILRSLFAGELCVNEIVEITKLMQANVSKQLRILLDCKVVVCRPSGLQRYYRVIDQKVIHICKEVCKTGK